MNYDDDAYFGKQLLVNPTQQPLVFEDLRRVNSRIGAAIVQFCEPKRVFHMSELLAYVNSTVAGYIAPDSPGRILRQLRQSGHVRYVVSDRSKSLYEVVSE